MQAVSVTMCDKWEYVPVVSTGVQLFRLFQRCVSEEVVEPHEVALLAPGGLVRAVCLLVPVIGNIIVLIYDKVRDCVLRRVATDDTGTELRDLWSCFQNDEEIVKAAVKKCGRALEFARPEFQNNEEIVLEAVTQDGRALEFASPELRSNEKIVTLAIMNKPEAIEYAGEEFQQEIRECIQFINNDMLPTLVHPAVKPWVVNVRSVVLAMVTKISYELHNASEVLKDDLEIVEEAVRKNGYTLEYASVRAKDTEALVRLAIEQDARAFLEASDRLKAMRDIVTQAVSKSGWLLEHVNEEFKNDLEIVRLAVREDGFALQYASEELRGNAELVRLAIEQDGKALQFAADAFRDDEAMVLFAMREDDGGDISAIKWATERVIKLPSVQTRLLRASDLERRAYALIAYYRPSVQAAL